MTYVSCFYHAFSGAQKVSWGGSTLTAVAGDSPSPPLRPHVPLPGLRPEDRPSLAGSCDCGPPLPPPSRCWPSVETPQVVSL